MQKILIKLNYLLLLCTACTNAPKEPQKTKHVNFYYWRTIYKLNASEQNACRAARTNTIYYRAFDVADLSKPHQVMQWQQKPLSNVSYVPCVYILNKIFLDLSGSSANEQQTQIDSLAARVVRLCTSINAAQQLPCAEIQVDCDWSVSTKDLYFKFLKAAQRYHPKITSTLRLWQYKSTNVAGIPPVDHVYLMCYNVGDIKASGVQNSILDLKTLKSYIHKVKPYPVHLTVALPLFEWYIQKRQGQFIDIHYQLPKGTWQTKDSTRFYSKSDGDNFSKFLASDTLTLERISDKTLTQSLQVFRDNKVNFSNEIILYSLDSASILKHQSFLQSLR